MKIFMLLVVAVSFLSFPAYGQENSEKKENNLSSEAQKPVVSEQEKEKLRQDAVKLAEDFKTIFKDFSFVGQKVVVAFVDSISKWILVNYEKISEVKREKLKRFMAEVKLKFADLEHMSSQKLTEVLRDLKDLLKQLENEAEQRSTGENTKLI